MINLEERNHIQSLIEDPIAKDLSLDKICNVIGINIRTLQRWRKPERKGVDKRSQPIHFPANKLSHDEYQTALSTLNSKRFANLSPWQIVSRLADESKYIVSESTFYRILRNEGQDKHRRSERPAVKRHKPRALLTKQPNQVYSWDITFLPTMIRGKHYYLYMYIDVFSRKITGWQVYESESSEQASELLKDICNRENISPEQLTIHSDNGAAMRGSTLRATMESLGIAPSFSRPSVSNDNPYSESLFRTLKYRPDYPVKPFETLLEARNWGELLVNWYNTEHRHSSISFVTPNQRHAGEDKAILINRKAVYEAAKAANPRRWTGKTRNWEHIDEVYLNPDKKEAS